MDAIFIASLKAAAYLLLLNLGMWVIGMALILWRMEKQFRERDRK